MSVTEHTTSLHDKNPPQVVGSVLFTEYLGLNQRLVLHKIPKLHYLTAGAELAEFFSAASLCLFA